MKDQNQNKEENNNTGNETFTQEQVDALIKERVDSVRGDLVSQIKELSAYKDTQEAAAREAENKKLEEQEQYKELLAKKEQESQSTISDLQGQIANLEKQNAEALQNNIMIESGVEREVEREGYKRIYSKLEDAPPFNEWIKTQLEELGANTPKGKSSGNVGGVTQGRNDNLDYVLKNGTDQEKLDALDEIGRKVAR